MNPPSTDRVLDELRQSPAWREAERSARAKESAHRRGLVAELAKLETDHRKEAPALAATCAEALKRSEAAHAAAAEADRDLAECRRLESSASTSYDAQRRRITAELERTAGERVATARAAIFRAMDDARALVWGALAGPNAYTGYRQVGTGNCSEIDAAIAELFALRDRPAELAAELADLEELEKALTALELRAREIVAEIPAKPADGWIDRAIQKLYALLYPSGVAS